MSLQLGKQLLGPQKWRLRRWWQPQKNWVHKRYSCKYYRLHGGNHKREKHLDVALIFQTEFVEISKKSVLKPCSEVVPKYETVIGRGLTNQNPDRSSDQLMEAELIENGNSRLQDSMNVMQHIFYSVPGRTAACHGDTGGPMVSKQNGKVVCLIGVSSFNAPRCDNPDYPSVFTSARAIWNWMWRWRGDFEQFWW